MANKKQYRLSDSSITTSLRTAIQGVMSSIRVGMPGVIESYDANEQSCYVKPVLTEYDGTELPILTRVPVIFPQGGGYSITFPLSAGDHVWLLFSERDIDSWLEYGGQRAPISPRMFDWSDAIAYAGISPYNSALDNATTDTLVIGEESSSGLKLKIKDGQVSIGTSTNELLKIISDLIAALQSAKVTTSLGLQPLDPATLTTLIGLKSGIDALKL